MGIYNGGSNKDCYPINSGYPDYQLYYPCNFFTGNTLPSTITSTGNQMFISYTNNGDGTHGKGFSASFTFGKKVANF